MRREQTKTLRPSQHAHRVCKRAAKALIKKAGNIDGAATISRLHRSALADTMNLNRRDRYLPIDALFELECVIADPTATRILASEQGYLLFPIPKGNQDSVWQKHLNRTVRKASRLFKHIIEAIEDNEVTKAEAEDLLEQVDTTLAAIGALRGALLDKIETVEMSSMLKAG